MEELVTQLADTARYERAVASRKMENGMQLMAYPMESGVLIALGFERDQAHRVQADDVLRKRSQDMAHYGAWLPAQFADGSWYVVRRLAAGGGDALHLPNHELTAAQELLT